MSKNTKHDLEMDFAYFARAAFLGIAIGFGFSFLVYNFKQFSNEKSAYTETVETLGAEKPQITRFEKSNKLPVLMQEAAGEHDLDYSLLSCLFKVESSYRMGVVSDTQDFGIGQINEVTIKHYKLDKELLLTDSTYAINATAKLLKQLKTQLKSDYERQWPCAYNIGVSGLLRGRKGAACEAYLEKLNSCIQSGDYL